MILSGKQILTLGIFEPQLAEKTVVRGRSAGPSLAGYDIRISLGGGPNMAFLRKGDFILATTIEKFRVPNNLVGVVHDKSTWARQGLAVQNTVIEPGWNGYLTLELTYQGNEVLEIRHGDPIAQVLFHVVSESTEGYDGKYQDQEQKPIPALFDGDERTVQNLDEDDS